MNNETRQYVNQKLKLLLGTLVRRRRKSTSKTKYRRDDKRLRGKIKNCHGRIDIIIVYSFPVEKNNRVVLFLLLGKLRSTRRRRDGACVRFIIMNDSGSAMFTRIRTYYTHTVYPGFVFYYRYWFVYLLPFFFHPFPSRLHVTCAC